jgi:hypothetical protein
MIVALLNQKDGVGKTTLAPRFIAIDEPRSARSGDEAIFSARLAIDDTPNIRGQIKKTAFQRGVTVADMLRELFARECPPTPRGTP